MIKKKNLGSLSLANNLVLAPLQNVTTAPFRRFCRKFQEIGLVHVPMIYTKRLTKSPKSIEHEFFKIEEERPISVQLIGSNLETLKKSIEYLESFNFDIIDINAGCPSKRAINAKEGGYLLKDLEKLEQILTVAVKYSSKPVSLKTRIGFESPNITKDLTKIANNSGIEFLTIHARTVKDRFENDTIDLDSLKEIKRLSSIPIIGNGDIMIGREAKHFFDYTKVDAIMIGRGTMGNPEIFHQINEYLSSGKEIHFENNLEKMKQYLLEYEQVLNDFLAGIEFRFDHDKYKFTELKRNAMWLSKNVKNSTILRKELYKPKTLITLKKAFKTLFK